jgi:hypothetical protein
MDIRAQVDLAIDENRRAPCLWVPAERWSDFCDQLGRTPNRIGVIVYRGKTLRVGLPYSEVTTQRPDEDG